MKPYFLAPERQAQLRLALSARAGTRFMEGVGKLGVGYDCAHLVKDCYEAAGVDVGVLDSVPQMSLQQGRFHNTGVVDMLLELPWVRRRMRLLDEDEPLLCGDLLGIRQYTGCNHLGIYDSGDWLWHVPLGGFVSRAVMQNFNIPLKLRLLEAQ